MDKIDSVDDLYIFYPPAKQSELEDKETYENHSEYLFDDNIVLQDLIDDFDPDLFSPKIKKIEINVFEDATIAVLEEFETVNHFKYPWYKKNNENDQLFLRNILVKDFTFDSQLMVKTISLVGFTITQILH